MRSFVRLATTLDVPESTAPGGRIPIELGHWVIQKTGEALTIPPQGYYLVKLENGSVITIVEGKEVTRTSGEMWSIRDGESMSIRVVGKHQQNALLRIVRFPK